jgi:hypothetical protein
VPCSIIAVDMPHIGYIYEYHSLFHYDFFTRDKQK